MEHDPTMSQDQAFGEAIPVDNTPAFNLQEEAPANPPASPAENPAPEVPEAPAPTEPEPENRVPYSRFKEVYEEKQTLAQKNAELEAKLNAPTPELDTPNAEWTALYGDSELARKAWAIQRAREENLVSQAVAVAEQKFKERISQAEEQEKAVQSQIDNYLTQASTVYGRKLTEEQQDALMSIAEEYSPTDETGRIVALIPPAKAVEIYKFKSSTDTRVRKQARVAVTSQPSAQGADAVAPAGDSAVGWDSWRDAITE